MSKSHRLLFRLAGAAVALGVAVAGGIAFWPASLPDLTAAKAKLPPMPQLIEKGKYLTIAADCAACHTRPGGKPLTGGFKMQLPMGVLYSPNITPDKETGIGSWSDEQFVRALRNGVDDKGENLYPAFTYDSFHLISDDDALAIKAYLFSLPPINYAPPKSQMDFPFNMRFLMRFWNIISVPWSAFTPDPAQSQEWNRGNYLVNALAHCGACHTPRTLWFSMNNFKRFAGSVSPESVAYNITPDKETGIGNWSDEELAQYLSTGHAENHGVAIGGMGEAVSLSLRHLTPQDIKAMIVYLRSVPPQKNYEAAAIKPPPASIQQSSRMLPAPDLKTSSQDGAQLFAGFCASCHSWNGEGGVLQLAALKGAKTVSDTNGTNLVKVILNGSTLATDRGDAVMPGFSGSLSDSDIAALSNFVIEHFGGKQANITPGQVSEAR